FVDSRHHEIGQRPEHLRDGDVDAVGWRALDAERAIVEALEPQRMTQRQRVADRTRFGHRRDDRHVSHGAQGIRQHANAFRSIPIVVGNENPEHEEGDYTTSHSSAVAASASAAPTPNAVAAPNAFHTTPKTTLAASAPMPCTAL